MAVSSTHSGEQKRSRWPGVLGGNRRTGRQASSASTADSIASPANSLSGSTAFQSINNAASPGTGDAYDLEILAGAPGQPNEADVLPIASTLVETLVQKYVSKLPHRAQEAQAVPLDSTAKTLKALKELCRYRLEYTLKLLHQELESVIKLPSADPLAQSKEINLATLDNLKSQLLLVQAIAECLAWHWEVCQPSYGDEKNASPDANSFQPRQDPPPLDDRTARQLLGAISFFNKQFHLVSQALASPGPRSAHMSSSPSMNSFKTSAEGSSPMLPSRSRQSSSPAAPSPNTYLQIAKAGPSNREIHPYLDALQSATEALNSIIAYISASRWDLMQAKVRNCIKHYATASEEALDLSEIRIIEHCSWSEGRLATLLAECGVLPQVKKSALHPLCSAIRKAIRQYYATDPYALARLYGGQYQPVFVGQPENLFLLAYNLSEGGKRKTLAWPLMASVLPLCVDGVTKMVNGQDTRPPSLNKKAQFLGDLRNVVRGGGKAGDVNLALSCYADMCHAATYTDGPPSILRGFTKDMHKDLLTRLLDPGRPFIQADGSLDAALTTDALLVVYKLSPSLVSRDVLPRLLSRSLSDPTVAASLNACSSILEESDILPWHPNGLDIGLTIITSVRKLLHSLVTAAFGVDESGQPSVRPLPQARASIADLASERNTLLMAITRLASAEPNLLHLKPEKNDSILSRRSAQAPSTAGELLVFNPHSASQSFLLLTCLVDEHYHPKVKQAAIDLFLRLQQCAVEEIDLHHPQYVDASLVFKETVESIGLAFVRQNLHTHADRSLEHNALQNLVEWLSMTQQILRQSESLPQLESLVEGCEIIGLLALASHTEDSRSLVSDLFEYTTMIASINETPSNAAGLARVIREEGSVIVGGRLAQMRRLVKICSSVTTADAGLQIAWTEANGRWKALSQKLQEGQAGSGGQFPNSGDVPGLLEQNIVEWTSLSAFLTATLHPATSSIATSYIPREALPLRYTLQHVQDDRGPGFVSALSAFLYSDNPRMRDAARELLSQDLHGDYLANFVESAHSVAESVFNAEVAETLSEELVLHFDQTLSVLLGILVRNATMPQLSREHQYRLEGIILSAYFHLKDLAHNATSIRLKTKVCRVTEMLMVDSSRFSLAFKSTLLAHLIAYIEKEAVTKLPTNSGVSEIQASALRALSALTHNLVVQRCASAMDKPATDHADSRFTRSCISLLLTTCQDLLSITPDSATKFSQIRPAMFSRTQSNPGQIPSANTNQREAVKTAIVNLVVSNLPAFDISAFGFDTSDPPSFHLTKLEMANSCMKIWSAKGGADSGVTRSPEKALQSLANIVCASDMQVVLAVFELAPSSEHDVLLDLIYDLFERRNMLEPLLTAVIAKEVREIAHESTLFRGNSAASRLLTIFARREGYFYLRSLVGDLLDRLAEESFGSLDLDVHQIDAPDDAHLTKLKFVAEAFLARICNTWSEIPASMRNLCYHIKSMVRDRFPDSEYTSIGGWIFLRFINPAIISPDLVDLELPEESREGRRALVLVSKLMQALSNNIRFKEPGMQSLNSFVSDHILDMTSFLTQISSAIVNHSGSQPERHVTTTYDPMECMMLYTFLWTNTEQIGSKLLTGNIAASDSRYPAPNVQRQWSRLTEVLWQVKQETGQQPPPRNFREAPSRIADLHASDQSPYHTLTVWANITRAGLQSRLGHQAISLALRKLHKDHTDYEGLAHYVMLATSSTPEPFDILLDCSGFAPQNEAPYDVLVLLRALLQRQSWLDRLHAIYLYAPNTAFVTYSRQISGIFSVTSIERKLHVLADLQELEDAFPDTMAVLDAETLALATEERIFSTTAILASEHREAALVTLSLTLTRLCVKPMKRKAMTSELRVAPLDIIGLKDIATIMPVFDMPTDALEIRRHNGSVLVLADLGDLQGFIQAFLSLMATAIRNLHFSAKDEAQNDLETLFAKGLASMTIDLTANIGYKIVHEVIQRYLAPLAQVPAYEAWTSLESQRLLEKCEQAAEKHVEMVPNVIMAILKTFPSQPDFRWIKLLPILRTFISKLATCLQSRAIAMSGGHEVVSMLLELSLAEDISEVLFQQKIWPVLLKQDVGMMIVVQHLQRQLQRLDLSSREQQGILGVLRVGPNVHVLRGRILQLAYTTLQAQDKPRPSPQDCLTIFSCFRMDIVLSETDPSSTLALAPEVAFMAATCTGLGTQEQQRMTALLSDRLLGALESNGPPREMQTNGSMAVSGPQHSIDDGKHLLPTVGPVDDLMRSLAEGLAAAVVSEDTRTMWTARLASLTIPIALQAGHPFQLQAVVILSHLTIRNTRVVAATLRAFLAELDGAASISTLQAFLTYFARAIKGSGDHALAGELFWVAISLINAHTSFLAPCAALIQACVTCITTSALLDHDNLQDYLLRSRHQSETMHARAKQLDAALQVEFAPDTFSFALASILAGHSKHPQLHDRISTILKHLTIMGNETAGTAAESQPILSILGYLVTLLPTASKRKEGFRVTDLLHAAGLEVKGSDMHEPYLPLLANVEISTNEPLVLASALATSLLLSADSDEERFLLLSFLQEVADLSPSVVMLLQNRLLSNLSVWIKTPNTRLMDVASSLLSTILSTPSDPNLPDITSYLGALGFLDLLDCTTRRPEHDPQTLSYRLSCCAGLLRAYHDL